MARSRVAGRSRAPCSRRGRASSPCKVPRLARTEAEAPAVLEDRCSTSSNETASVTSKQETASTETPPSPSLAPAAQPVEVLQSSSPDPTESPKAPEDRSAGLLSVAAPQDQPSLPAEAEGAAGPRVAETRRSSSSEVSGEDAEKIRQLRRLMDPGQPLGSLSDFAKEYGDEAFCGRLLRKYDGSAAKAGERFKHALHWREQNREVLTTRRCAHGSDERVVAADLRGRPILYTCLRNQMLSISQSLDQKVVAMLQAIDNMPAGVETTTQIWDLHGMRFRMSDLNPSPLVKMVQSTEGYFAERLEELIIIEMPRMALALKDAMWPLVPEKTRNKIRFMTAEQAKEYMRATCDPDAAGRVVAIMEQNRDPETTLEERKRSWMRVSTGGELVPAFAQA